ARPVAARSPVRRQAAAAGDRRAALLRRVRPQRIGDPRRRRGAVRLRGTGGDRRAFRGRIPFAAFPWPRGGGRPGGARRRGTRDPGARGGERDQGGRETAAVKRVAIASGWSYS